MAAKITFFPVDNGDMTLVRLADTRVTTLLIDIHIRVAADDPADPTPDVASELRKRLQFDREGRPFVDAFLLSHPDKDHCSGLRKHFWLGDPDEYPDDELPLTEKRILIRELWSSPMVFRRRSKNHTLCEDAQAFNAEARRRVKYWRTYHSAGDGNRILIMGEDENGKTDDLTPIVVKAGETFSTINGDSSSSMYFSARLLAPAPKQADEKLEETLSKNHSSVILNLEIFPTILATKRTRFLTGGDAEVAIWQRLWDKYQNTPDVLAYDLLQAPHHCSWHSLSYDSWSTYKEEAEVCEEARNALSQAREGATIVASSKQILDDDKDPPCIRAKREYQSIVRPVDGTFLCTGDGKRPELLELEVQSGGSLVRIAAGVIAATGSAVAAAAPRAGRP
ncbi:metallohydrolase [Pseudomonas taiwanensis]|uniref:metallohydrolase n=1 Tax=Pseudomonas taiwanensis TaxID=470150 RepID=UPI0015B8D895|nr:metallohydrolase [Pseudomonas taiwanensis]NWL78014.1 metallohydrolase [Pseudomonas taiwanensis]